MNISDEAVEAAAKGLIKVGDAVWDAMPQYAKELARSDAHRALEAAAPHMATWTALDSVLDISNVRMDSEHGDPAFLAGWEAALEEVSARIAEATK